MYFVFSFLNCLQDVISHAQIQRQIILIEKKYQNKTSMIISKYHGFSKRHLKDVKHIYRAKFAIR